jgi:Kef-type K+ transport system membrane component KefB
VSELLITIVVILVAGVAGQLVAKWLRVPSVVFYLAIGLLLGEAGVGLVTLETFGDGGGALSTVVAGLPLLSSSSTARSHSAPSASAKRRKPHCGS